MSAKIDEARKLGRDMLAKHGEPTQALPHFISALHRRKLLASVALDFLENLGQKSPVLRDQMNCAEKPPPTTLWLMPTFSLSAAAPFTHKRNETKCPQRLTKPGS